MATKSLFDFIFMIKLPFCIQSVYGLPPPACTNFHNVTEETMNNLANFSLLRGGMLLAPKKPTFKNLKHKLIMGGKRKPGQKSRGLRTAWVCGRCKRRDQIHHFMLETCGTYL